MEYEGREENEPGDIYNGDWKNDKMTGEGKEILYIGIMSYFNGANYDGEWKDNLRHGYGMCISNGIIAFLFPSLKFIPQKDEGVLHSLESFLQKHN